MKRNSRNSIANVWLAFGGLLALGVTMIILRELPAMRRELHIMRM